jgi:hypothetical protein
MPINTSAPPAPILFRMGSKLTLGQVAQVTAQRWTCELCQVSGLNSDASEAKALMRAHLADSHNIDTRQLGEVREI